MSARLSKLVLTFIFVAIVTSIGGSQVPRFRSSSIAFRHFNSPGIVQGFPDPKLSPPPKASTKLTRFAVIGDYGDNSRSEAEVAALVKSWNPEFIITTGDNNYRAGAASTIDQNIGQYYAEFIYPYTGNYPPQGRAAATINRFFPTLGNHDWKTPNAQPYLDYFTLPGNEYYYDFEWGPVHFFALDSNDTGPDWALQTAWLKEKLAASTAPWKLVYMHHPPFSSGQHGSHPKLQAPYQAWGATAVLAGHDHIYERIMKNGFPYFVNGLGGHENMYLFGEVVPGSQVRYNDDYGAMLVEASKDQIIFQFIARTGETIDLYAIKAASSNLSLDLPPLQKCVACSSTLYR